MLEIIFETLKTHEQWLWLLGLSSILLFFVTALVIPLAIILLPVDYFARIPDMPFTGRHPVIALFLIIVRNTLGAVLLAAGIIMLFLPGQGLLTILIALALIDFPGKHRLLLRLISNRRLLNAANGIRRWAKKPEFVFPNLDSGDGVAPPSRAERGKESLRRD